MYDLGLRLKELRIERGLTQESLGNKINKSKSAICSYETNAQMPPLDVLISIAIVLNVSLDYLVAFDTEIIYSTKGLTSQQKEIVDLLFSEFTSSTSDSLHLSQQQILILQKLILLFSKNNIPSPAE